MKPSEALKIARGRIKKGARYICLALPDGIAGDIVKLYIKKALNGSYTYEGWLRTNKNIKTYGSTRLQRQDSRIAWVDWMIKEYERIGQ